MAKKGEVFPGGRAQQQAEAAERRVRALSLRIAGATFAQIAEQVGYAGPGPAHRAVMEAIAEIKRETAEEALRVELVRCDALLVGLWPKARKGEEKAVNSALRVMERRARLLGLDDFDARMAKVAERMVELEAEKLQLVRVALARGIAAAELGAEQRAVFLRVFAAEVRARGPLEIEDGSSVVVVSDE